MLTSSHSVKKKRHTQMVCGVGRQGGMGGGGG